MKEKKLVEIQKGLGKHLAAVYQYESPHGMIPIFVLDVVDFRVLYKVKGDFEKEKCIVLSKDDVKNGSDVFPLRFLHMKNHSRLFAGKDVLADIVLEKRDLLRNIELELRTKMIQLREDYLSGSFKDFLKNMESFMSVIGEGLEYIDPALKGDGKFFDDRYDPLDVVSHINLSLEDLCAKIDTRQVA